MRILFILLISCFSQAQVFNNKLSVQGFLKVGTTAVNDVSGYPMRFLIKRNSTVIWCQDSAANVPVISGIFSSLLAGTSNCQALSNTLEASLFNHSLNSDNFIVDVVVDVNKDGFGGADDATFAGIDLVPSPLAIHANLAEVAKSLSITLPISSGGTGATTAAGARTNLGLGSVSAVNTSGVATDVLLGDGTFGAVPSPVNFSGNLSGDVSGTQSATVVTALRGQNISTTAPTNSQVLVWNNALSQWVPSTLVSANIADAVSTNTASRLVLRDATGNFAANVITASTFSNAAGTTTTIGNTATTSATIVQAGTGKVRIGATGTAVTGMGACTIASSVITRTATTRTCTGIPASTGVAVYCSPAAALSSANTNSVFCRASGTANQVVCNTTVTNTINTTYSCMWMQP